MPVPIVWPPLPAVALNDPQAEVKKVLYQAQVQAEIARWQAEADAVKAQAAADLQREQATWTSEFAMQQAVHNAYLDLTKGSLDRAQQGAQFVERAAATISGADAAALGLSFAIGKDVNRPLPARGIAPALLLGLAIVLATAYRTYVGGQAEAPGAAGGAVLQQVQQRRLVAFMNWVGAAVSPRRFLLQAAVVGLGFGVALLPIAFLSIDDGLSVSLSVAAVFCTFFIPAVLAFFTRG